mgnify:CR=1 FL=1
MSNSSDLPPALTSAPAIEIRDVTKVYRLHTSQTDQLIEVLGLQRMGIHPKSPANEFPALGGVNLTVPKGERIGIVGRNGAGKSTLLKLICGNIKPTSGSIEVNGLVQALLTAGSGFNPDFTGIENARASLQYNGLGQSEYAAAIEEIEEFCELGPFFHQPFKTYSAGMQARLMFATATAVKPEILIVDEVLGAGDAYFIAKSKRRVEQLVTGGCTMLLVSHAMGQILELCQRTIWIHEGKIHMEGDSFEVIKAYEAFLHGTIQHSGFSVPDAEKDPNAKNAKSSASKGAAAPTLVTGLSDNPDIRRPAIIQEPRFWPGEQKMSWPEVEEPVGFNYIARGGITPWDGTRNLVFSGFTIVNENGPTNELLNLRPAKFVLEITAKTAGDYSLRYAVVIFDHLGHPKINLCSGAPDTCHLEEGETRIVEVELAPVQLGEDEYIVSLGLYDFGPLEVINSAVCHDLLSRCFEFRVKLPETLRPIAAEFSHPAEWNFPEA